MAWVRVPRNGSPVRGLSYTPFRGCAIRSGAQESSAGELRNSEATWSCAVVGGSGGGKLRSHHICGAHRLIECMQIFIVVGDDPRHKLNSRGEGGYDDEDDDDDQQQTWFGTTFALSLTLYLCSFKCLILIDPQIIPREQISYCRLCVLLIVGGHLLTELFSFPCCCCMFSLSTSSYSTRDWFAGNC